MCAIRSLMTFIRDRDAATYISSMVKCFAAPTIRGFKAGSLINLRRHDEDVAGVWRRNGGEILRTLGVESTLLREGQESALVLIYHKDLLRETLSERKAQEILRLLGYPCTPHSLDAMLAHLQERFNSQRSPGEDFPHEIGLFLGYPPEDVEGFIRNKGAGSLEGGYWKVYGNVKRARKSFRSFRRAEQAAARALLCQKETTSRGR